MNLNPLTMKKLFLFYFLLWAAFMVNAQTLTAGLYTSADGYYTVSVSQEGNDITLTEPNKVNLYRSSGGNMYYHTEPKYADYYLKVTGAQEYYTGKKGGTEYQFTYSGNSTDEVLADSIANCPLYTKYLTLSGEDELNAQVWTFCGAAALVKCTYNEQGANEYVASVIVTLKSFLEDPSTCPCTDVIPQTVWNAH
ncbi:hypothetical protein [Empedobacter brevis]|nr:hypothetical protein [Empedobacter brevis]